MDLRKTQKYVENLTVCCIVILKAFTATIFHEFKEPRDLRPLLNRVDVLKLSSTVFFQGTTKLGMTVAVIALEWFKQFCMEATVFKTLDDESVKSRIF